MKYYLIVGEASGDLHASHLMRALAEEDGEAQFRFIGGDLMATVGGTRVRHYKEMAYMGFVPVLLHLRTILRNMRLCKRDIVAWQPDVVILVDYPGFNLDIAKFLKRETQIPAYYYIAPKIWAWKEWRIRSIKRDVAELFSILPFEVPFFEQKHHYPIHYVGNPTADEVRRFRADYREDFATFCREGGFADQRPIIALLAGSREQEIKDNLPAMLRAVQPFAADYQVAVAGAPSIDDAYYARFLKAYHPKAGAGDMRVTLVRNNTYALLSHATAALVTSGTATLETALFGVPQVVCYETPVPHLIRFAFNHIIKVRFISLVNLTLDREVVPELLADRFSVANMQSELAKLLPGQPERERMLADYEEVRRRLGNDVAPVGAARLMVRALTTPSRR